MVFMIVIECISGIRLLLLYYGIRGMLGNLDRALYIWIQDALFLGVSGEEKGPARMPKKTPKRRRRA